MRVRARESSWRFSEKVFSDAWLKQMEKLIEYARGTTASMGGRH